VRDYESDTCRSYHFILSASRERGSTAGQEGNHSRKVEIDVVKCYFEEDENWLTCVKSGR